MRARALVGMGLAASLGACAGDGEPWWRQEQGSPPVAAQDPVAGPPGQLAARSIWGVVPNAPRRKADLRASQIAGSAVAVADNTLLAHCLAVAGRSSVGLVRHNKYRIATVTPDATGQLCRLTVTEGPLTPAAGWRSFADLRVGEPVTALASRTSAEVAAAAGWLAGKGSTADPYLEATSAVPDGNRSAVLFDGFGNLIGLGAAAPVAGGLMLAVPVDARVAPALVNRDLGAADVLLAALTPTPRAQPRQAPILLAVGSDDRNSADRAPPARQTAAARIEERVRVRRAQALRPGRGRDAHGRGPAVPVRVAQVAPAAARAAPAGKSQARATGAAPDAGARCRPDAGRRARRAGGPAGWRGGGGR